MVPLSYSASGSLQTDCALQERNALAGSVPILVALADDQPLEPRHHDHALNVD